MIEYEVDIRTADGEMDTFIVRPQRGLPHPAIVMLMDAAGVRESVRDIARRIATSGYAVFLPNLYYRIARGFVAGPLHSHPDAEPNMQRVMQHRSSVGHAEVIRDVGTLLRHIEANPIARRGKIGTVGYCMSGAYVVTTAASHAGRIACGASFYGTRLMEDRPDAPWRRLGEVRAELYFAFAETDFYVPLAEVEAFNERLSGAPFTSTVELFPGTGHGFAFPDSSHYDKPAAERHFEAMLDLFRRCL
ncbi:MAG: dienelactone hydrolase family protein [Alphaproteobacteria bacterium]|nr:dienelactone hydrolase family protein [Alphaproteobacteria bacterium]